MSLRASDVVPRTTLSSSPSSGRKRRIAPRKPSSVIALAYLCAYGMHGKKVISAYRSGFCRTTAQTSAIRSWVVHMKVRTPSS